VFVILFFSKVVSLKVVQPLKICQHTTFVTSTYYFRIHLSSTKMSTSLYSKASLKWKMMQIKLVGMSVIFHFTKLRSSKWCNGSWVISIKQNVNFQIHPPAMFVYFSFVFRKSDIIQSFSSSEDLSAYKVSLSHVQSLKFCIHLRSSNVRHFGMVEATGLKLWR
jgi:hypothetical protein